MEAFQDSQDEEVLFGGNRSQLTKTKFLLIILSVIAFILLVLSIVFITLYSLEKSKQHVTPAEKKVAKEQKDCGTRASLIASLGKPIFFDARRGLNSSSVGHVTVNFTSFVLNRLANSTIIMPSSPGCVCDPALELYSIFETTNA